MTAATPADGRPRSPLSVILCDDNALLLDTLSEVVRAQSDMEVVGTARDSEQALQLASHRRPDLVVLDFRFPGGGHVVAQGIAQCSPASRIVAFSAYDDKGSIELMKNAGVVAYVLKGASNRELLTALRQAAAVR
ncbi:response regulator [Streptomyces sp. NPDC002853]